MYSQRGILMGRKIERERHFWDVAEYGQFFCDVEEQLPSGKKLEAEKLWGDQYPNGAYVVYAGDTVIDIQPVEKKRRWVVVQYGKMPGSSTGAGAKMLIPLNDIINDDYNLYHAVKTTSARPFTVVAGQSVKLLPEAGQFLRIDKLPAGVKDIRAVIAQYPGQSVAGMGDVNQQIQSAMQFIMGTSTVGGSAVAGAPDMKAAGTATGIAAMQEQAAGRQIGPIGQRIAADKETIWICLENRRDYSSTEQKEELAKRYGQDIADLFFKTNFRQVMSIEIAPNTDMPRSMALTQANMMAFAQIAEALIPVIGQIPWAAELLSTIADSMNIPFNIGPGRNDRREAEFRLNKLASIEEFILSEQPDLVTNSMAAAALMYEHLAKHCFPLVEKMPDKADDVPRMFMQDHNAFMDVYKDAIFSEQGKAWSNARKLAVLKLWEGHYVAQLGKQFEEAALTAELQAELNPAPPEPTQPSPEEVAAAQGQEDQRALAEHAIKHETDEEAKDSQLERDLVKQEHAAQKAQELERVRQEARPNAK
jgi:hypothetical protein